MAGEFLIIFLGVNVMKNFLKIFSLAILILGLSSQTSFAKSEIVEASGTYVIDVKVDETFAAGTARAREEAKRIAAEKAGVYVQSYSKTVNLELDYDEIKTVTAQLLKVQDGEKIDTKSLEGGLIEIKVTIKALVEFPNDEMLKTMMSDKQNLEEATAKYKILEQEYEALKKEMEVLKGDYRNANAAEKVQIKDAIERNGKYFSALIELEQGNNFYFRRDYQNAVNSYTNAINIQPNFAEAYNNRGNAYVQLQNYSQALQDLQNAARLNSVDSRIYNNLGNVYLMQQNYNSAIKAYSQAINLNSNLFTAYFNRALAYSYLGQFKNALPDAKRAMKLNPADNDAKNLYDEIASRV